MLVNVHEDTRYGGTTNYTTNSLKSQYFLRSTNFFNSRKQNKCVKPFGNKCISVGIIMDQSKSNLKNPEQACGNQALTDQLLDYSDLAFLTSFSLRLYES